MAALRKKKFESLIKKEERRRSGGRGNKKRESLPPPTNAVGESGDLRQPVGDDPGKSPATAVAPPAAAAVAPHAEATPPVKGVSGAARIPNRSSSSSEERREERANSSRLLTNGPSEEATSINSNKNIISSSGSSSNAGHPRDGSPQAQAVPTKAVGGPSGPSDGGPAPKDGLGEKAREQEKLREQLQKLVSNKLSTLGDLDHAGLVALEALSKMPPPPGTTVPRKPGSPTTGGNALGGVRPRKNLPPGLEKVPRFTGKNLGALSDTLTRFHSLVVAALPGSSLQTVNRALLRDIVFILEGSALKFYDALKDGQIQWEPVPPIAGGAAATEHQAAVRPYFQPPSTWAQVCEAFHDHYLPAEGIARTSGTLLSLSQAPGESVRSLAARQLGLTSHLSRLIAADGSRTSFWDAMSIGLFERALRLDLRRMQNAESPCSSFENSVNRAERNAALANTVVNSMEGGSSGGGGGIAVNGDGAGGGTAVNEGGSGSDGKLKPGENQAHVRSAASGLQQQHHDVLRPSSHGVVGSTDVLSAAGTAAAAADEVVPKNADSSSRTSDNLVTVKCEGAAAGTDTKLSEISARALLEVRARLDSAVGSDGRPGQADVNGVSYLNGGEAASDLSGGDRSQPFEDALHGSMMPLNDGGPILPQAAWRQDPGGRERSGDFGGSREEWRRNSKNERKRQRERHQGNGGDGKNARPWPHGLQGDLVGDRPPCTVPQCRAINRQFHCANECYYHPEHGKFGRSRGGGGRKRPSRAMSEREPAEFDGYNNFSFQRAPYTDTFGTEHYF